MARVMDLPNWPPDSGGPFDPRSHRFAISSEEVVIDEVTKVDGTKITFTCLFDGNKLTYDFSAPSVRTAEKLAEIIRENSGKALFSIGMIEIPRGDERGNG